MKTSKESMGWYNKTNKAWADLRHAEGLDERGFTKPLPCDFKTAKKYCRKIWREQLGRRLPYEIKETHGNRYTWVRRGTLYINVDRGWDGTDGINHLFSHWIGHRKGFSRPHCAEHACLEWRGMNMIKDLFIEQSRQALATPVKPKPTVDIIKKRYDRLLARQKSWAKKAKASEKNLKKINSEIKIYEKRHGERLAG